MLLKKYKEKLPDNPKTNDLIDDEDTLNVPTIFLGWAGCIIPQEEEVNAPPNGQKFLIHPTEHSHKNSNN